MDNREKLQSIRGILLEQWDPVGVRNEPTAQDEYDRYLPALLRMLESRASSDEVARYLGDIVDLEMELVTVAERDEAVANALLQLHLR